MKDLWTWKEWENSLLSINKLLNSWNSDFCSIPLGCLTCALKACLQTVNHYMNLFMRKTQCKHTYFKLLDIKKFVQAPILLLDFGSSFWKYWLDKLRQTGSCTRQLVPETQASFELVASYDFLVCNKNEFALCMGRRAFKLDYSKATYVKIIYLSVFPIAFINFIVTELIFLNIFYFKKTLKKKSTSPRG